MIGISDAAGVVTQSWGKLHHWEKVQLVMPFEAKRTLSPAAGYAVEAVKLLGRATHPQAMVCMSGPTGMMADAFAPIKQQAEDNCLWGPDFPRRSRRMHPLTLVRNLQNQVPSVLSMTFGIHGPVVNALDSATALAYLLPNLAQLLKTYSEVLLVMASAANRREEAWKRECFNPASVGLEGAFAFILDNKARLGSLKLCSGLENPSTTGEWQPGGKPIADAILAAGAGIVSCLVENVGTATITLKDGCGHNEKIKWEGN